MNLPDGRRGLLPPNPRRRAYPGEHPVTPSCSVGYKWSLCVNDYQCLLRLDCVIACNHKLHRLAYATSFGMGTVLTRRFRCPGENWKSGSNGFRAETQ